MSSRFLNTTFILLKIRKIIFRNISTLILATKKVFLKKSKLFKLIIYLKVGLNHIKNYKNKVINLISFDLYKLNIKI